MVRASALKSDYVLMDPGSNPPSSLFLLNKLFDVDLGLTI